MSASLKMRRVESSFELLIAFCYLLICLISLTAFFSIFWLSSSRVASFNAISYLSSSKALKSTWFWLSADTPQSEVSVLATFMSTPTTRLMASSLPFWRGSSVWSCILCYSRFLVHLMSGSNACAHIPAVVSITAIYYLLSSFYFSLSSLHILV